MASNQWTVKSATVHIVCHSKNKLNFRVHPDSAGYAEKVTRRVTQKVVVGFQWCPCHRQCSLFQHKTHVVHIEQQCHSEKTTLQDARQKKRQRLWQRRLWPQQGKKLRENIKKPEAMAMRMPSQRKWSLFHVVLEEINKVQCMMLWRNRWHMASEEDTSSGTIWPNLWRMAQNAKPKTIHGLEWVWQQFLWKTQTN